MTKETSRSIFFVIFALTCLCVFAAGCGSAPAEPVSEQPVSGQPVVEQPVTEKPGVEQPAAEQPAQQPVTGQPAAIAAVPVMDDGTMYTTNPGEIIEEMYAFDLGGPGDGICVYPQTKPVLDEVMTEAELMEVINLYSCGWQVGETVEFDAIDPNGNSLAHATVQAGPGNDYTSPGYISIAYQPFIDDPTGTYVFTLKGSGATLVQTVQVTRPNGPRLYLLSANPWEPKMDRPSGKQNSLLLWGFAPGENVRLVVYRDLVFLGYQDFVFPDADRMQVDLNLSQVGDKDSLFFMARGTQSGIIKHVSDDDKHSGFASLEYLSCPGAMLSRLNNDMDKVRAAYVDGSALRIRNEPSFTSEVLQSVPEGTELEFEWQFHQVRCVDGTFWWHVYIPGEERNTGWVAETYEGKYILEPIPNP